MGLYSEDGLYSSDDINRLEALYQSLAQQYNKSSAVKVNIPFCSLFSFFAFSSLKILYGFEFKLISLLE